jgi:hypothetical protein
MLALIQVDAAGEAARRPNPGNQTVLLGDVKEENCGLAPNGILILMRLE